MSTPPPPFPGSKAGVARRLTSWLVILPAVVLFVLLRSRWIGHLLSWDEAMNLLTVRALVGGGTDSYSLWFWRHPPLFHVFSMLLEPLRAGFAERDQWLALGMGVTALIPLYLLNRRAYGTGVALAALCFLAVMPGAVFFGTWIKEEPLVIFFGLMAFLCFDRRRHWLAGLALGLACLSKELGVFYALAVAGLWCLRSPHERRWRDLAATAATCFLTAFWWYLLFSVSLQHFWQFSIGHGGVENLNWAQPWQYYFSKLPGDLEWIGLAWLVAGAAAAGWQVWKIRREPAGQASGGDLLAAWPLALLLPALTVLALARGKTPWFTVTLYPAMATLQGLGLVIFLREWPRRWRPGWPRRASHLLAGLTLAVTAGLLLYPRLGDSYEGLANRQQPALLKGAILSARAAAAMNALVRDNERVLLTPMQYWHTGSPVPCPIFVYYFRPAPVVVRLNNLSPQEVVYTVRRYQLDWIMLSPPPDTGDRELLLPLVQHYGLQPAYTLGTCVFRTTALWTQPVPGTAPTPASELQ